MPKKFRPYRHGFKFEFAPGHVITKYARVRPATSPVTITLTEAHVREALRLGGIGDLRNCAGAVCVRRNGDAFPHPVVGYTDFADSRAWVASKVRAHFPTECVEYVHNDRVAKLFDTDPKRLLKILQQAGPHTLSLQALSTTGRNKAKEKPAGRGIKPRAKPRTHKLRRARSMSALMAHQLEREANA